MYGSRGTMLGSGDFLDGYEVGSKRPRMMDSNPYFAVSSSSSSYPSSYGSGYGSRESNYGVGLGGYGGGMGGGNNIYSFPVVRLRGLPFNCTDLDIYSFFSGLDVVDCLLTNKNGRFSGEAFVVFTSPMQAEFALQRDRQNMGRRYVEVFRCKKQDYYHAIANEVTECHHGSPPAKKPHDDKDQMEYTEILKLRGLPFSATKADIIEFFGEFELSEDNVHVALRADGKATGEAYVEFSSAEEARRAMKRDKMMIGSRYVELFPSTPEDARRAESRFRQ